MVQFSQGRVLSSIGTGGLQKAGEDGALGGDVLSRTRTFMSILDDSPRWYKDASCVVKHLATLCPKSALSVAQSDTLRPVRVAHVRESAAAWIYSFAAQANPWARPS